MCTVPLELGWTLSCFGVHDLEETLGPFAPLCEMPADVLINPTLVEIKLPSWMKTYRLHWHKFRYGHERAFQSGNARRETQHGYSVSLDSINFCLVLYRSCFLSIPVYDVTLPI